MDALDARILRAMRTGFWCYPPQSPDAFKPGVIAKAVRSTPETVKQRIERMEQQGSIRRYTVVPHLSSLGLQASSHTFHIADDDAKARAKERVGLVDGVIAIFDYVGPEMAILVAYASQAECDRRLALLAQQTGDPKPGESFRFPARPGLRPLTPLDWRLVQALRPNALRPLEDVAADVGVTYRTVKRRLDAMFEEGALERSIVPDPGNVPGLVPMELYLSLVDAEPETVNRIFKAFDAWTVVRFLPDTRRGHHVMLWLFVETLAQAETLRQQARALAGVKRARALLRREVINFDGWIDDLIAQRAKGAP